MEILKILKANQVEKAPNSKLNNPLNFHDIPILSLLNLLSNYSFVIQDEYAPKDLFSQ